MTLRLLFLACLLSLAASMAATAETADPPLLTLDADLTELELAQKTAPEKGKAATPLEFDLPVHLGSPAVKIERVILSQAGRILAGNALADPPALTEANGGNLHLAFDLSKFDAAGFYQLTLEVSAPTKPATAKEGGTSPPPEPKRQTVKLKLNKPAAVLNPSIPSFQSLIVVERVAWLPCSWSWCGATLEPSKITFNESGGKSWLNIDPGNWNVVLRKENEPPEEHRLQVALPAYVNGWGQADATLALEGPVSLGTSSGVLTIRSPQLEKKTVDFNVTVVSRLTRLWVLLTILAGIGLGYLFRGKLEASRVRTEALLAAERERGRLKELIGKTVDEDVKKDLEKTLVQLANVIDAPESLPDAINAAATTARTERETRMKEADVKIKELGAALHEWKRASVKIDALPAEVETALAALRQVLEEQSTALGNRNIKAVDDAIKHSIPEATSKVCTQIDVWLDRLAEALETLQPWPETRLDKLVDPLKQDIKTYQGTLVPLTPATSEALRERLLGAANLLETLRAKLFTDSAACVNAKAEALGKDLLKVDAPPAREIAALDTARADLQKPIVAGGPASASELVGRLNAVWEALQKALATVCKTPAQLALLKAGRFSEALSVEISPAETQLGEPGEAENMPSIPDALAGDRAGIPESEPHRALEKAWSIRLAVPPEANVAEPVTVLATTEPPSMDKALVKLKWMPEVGVTRTQGASQLEAVFTFQDQGPSYVEVIATGPDGTTSRAVWPITIKPAQGAAALPGLQRKLDLVNLALNLLSAAIIGVIGWAIFSPNFIGTFPEFFSAFAWGFTVDLGAAKVRELTDPAKALKPTFSLAQK